MKKLFTLALAIGLVMPTLNATVVYNDFAPDLTMAFGATLSFDLDGDMNDDITFSSSGSGASDYVISVTGANVQFAGQASGNYTENLFIGKLVNAGKNWLASNANIASAANKDIAGGNEFYIGVRVAGSNNNYFYGWILLELKANLELVVKSTAFETNLPQIVVGNTGSALLSEEELQSIDWSFFPTQVNDLATITASENINSLQVWNQAGQLILSEKPNAEKAELRLAELPSGIYILTGTTENGQKIEERFLKL
jgi:hypothetical protein